MKELLANPYVSRFFGALGAGLTAYAIDNNWKTALSTAVTFFVYGAAHAKATSTGAAA